MKIGAVFGYVRKYPKTALILQVVDYQLLQKKEAGCGVENLPTKSSFPPFVPLPANSLDWDFVFLAARKSLERVVFC